jgi:SAM-dependent methyltransferase
VQPIRDGQPGPTGQRAAGAAAPGAGCQPEICPCGETAWRHEEWTSRGHGRRVGYLACIACGTLRLEPRPTEQQLAAAYDPAYFGAGANKFVSPIEPIVALSRGRRVRRAARLLRQAAGAGPGRVLDLGCGDGRFLEQLLPRGHAVAGTELSPATALRAARIQGIDLRTGALDEGSFPRESFHLITAWHVLEHLPDPGRTLRLCRQWLAPGGRLLIAVPNAGSWQAGVFRASWFHLDPPRHLYQFSAAALRRILAAAGFEAIAVRHLTFGQNVYGVLQSTLSAVGGRPAQLYELLKGNEHREPAWRFALPVLCGALLLPPSLVFALCEGLAGRGGTIEVVAQARSPRLPRA